MLKLEVPSLGMLGMRGMAAPYLATANRANVGEGGCTRDSWHARATFWDYINFSRSTNFLSSPRLESSFIDPNDILFLFGLAVTLLQTSSLCSCAIRIIKLASRYRFVTVATSL